MNSNEAARMTARIQSDNPFFEIIEAAYRTFNYPKPNDIGVCKRCCMTPEIENDFFNPEIRELPLRYIRNWYSAAYAREGVPKETWGYLLPRILECLAVGEDVSNVAIELSLDRFDTGNPSNWSQAEWDVLDRFQRMYLAMKIEQGGDLLDDILCMFSLARWNLQDLIDQVSSTSNEILVERLWNDWCWGDISGRHEIWITPFWPEGGNPELNKFYTSKDLSDRMKAIASSANVDPEFALKASAIAKVIAASR